MYSLLWVTRSQELRQSLRERALSRSGIWEKVHLYFSQNCTNALRNIPRFGVDIVVLDADILSEDEENSFLKFIKTIQEKYSIEKGEILVSVYLASNNRSLSHKTLNQLIRQIPTLFIINPWDNLDFYLSYYIKHLTLNLELLRRNFLLQQENQNLLNHRASRLPKQLEFDYSFDYALHLPPPAFLFYQCINGKNFREMLLLAAENDKLTLLLRDSGSESEAAAIFWHHHNPARRYKPFVSLDFSQIARKLQKEALFGKVEQGRKHPGALERAAGGTLFLENIDFLDWDLQGSLVDVINEKAFSRIGEKKKVSLNCQLILSAPKDLVKHAEKNRFRQDLFYKISHMPIRMPSLAEVKDDIPVILDSYNRWYCKRFAKEIFLSPELKEFLCQRKYPGNFQELYSLLYRLHSHISHGELKLEHLLQISESHMRDEGRFSEKPLRKELMDFLRARKNHSHQIQLLFQGTLEELEKKHIEETLAKFNYNISHTAKSLGITRKTLYEKLKKYGVIPKRQKIS